MNAHIVFGLFALYVAITSLYLVLIGQQDGLLANLRKWWGRAQGHALYFIALVALPLGLCALCLSWGIRHYDATEIVGKSKPFFQLNVDYYRDMVPLYHRADLFQESQDIIQGA